MRLLFKQNFCSIRCILQNNDIPFVSVRILVLQAPNSRMLASYAQKPPAKMQKAITLHPAEGFYL